jgi:hypothetical protein
MAYDLAVETGQRVTRGNRLGGVLSWPDDISRSHLHFEIRTFFLSDLINGDHPSHGFTCGYQCPPGPGYWPLDAEHPSALGWLNPTHAIARRMFTNGVPDAATVVVPTRPSGERADAWSSPPWRSGARQVDTISLEPGMSFPLVQIIAGADDSRARSANGYRLWYRVALPDRERVWVQAASPSTDAVGLDGQPASVVFNCLPSML